MSKVDIASWSDVRFTPKSGHQQSALGCALKHETSVALSVGAKSLLRLTASLFALGPELLTLLTM
jgi:hypothetical protein